MTDHVWCTDGHPEPNALWGVHVRVVLRVLPPVYTQHNSFHLRGTDDLVGWRHTRTIINQVELVIFFFFSHLHSHWTPITSNTIN